MTESEFQEDTLKARNILQAAIGCEVIGYRAPSFSVSRSNIDWYYRVLSAAGFRYSSSVFPGKTYLYGIPAFPTNPTGLCYTGTRWVWWSIRSPE